jgi:hypothetical protein
MKKIYLYATIPFLLILISMSWGLILEGFSSDSDFLVLSSALATGILIVALFYTIKFYLKKLL